MRLVVISVVLLLVLGAGGFGAYMYLSGSAVASEADGGHEAGGHGTSHASNSAHGTMDDSGHGGILNDYEFVELEPLILPIIDDNGLSQVVSLIVAIEVKSASSVPFISTIEPKIKDAYIQEMYGYLSRETALNAGGAIKVKYLKEKLNKITVKLLGTDIVNDVLLTVVQQRPA